MARGGLRLGAVARHLTGSAEPGLPQLSLAEVARHRSRSSCWVVLWDKVYDFTPFLDLHPGGFRGLLRNAGGDATATFQELHSDAIFHAFAEDYLIGILPMAERSSVAAPAASPPAAHSAPPRSHALALASPFPHGRFDGTGLECVRFTWADDDLNRGYFAEGRGSSPSPTDLSHVHRQKSGLSPLNEPDWLALGTPEEYAQNMNLKKQVRHISTCSGAFVSSCSSCISLNFAHLCYSC